MDILAEIFANKRLEVAARKRISPLAQVRRLAEESAQPADFVRALRGAAYSPALIAEVKFRSPSKGELVTNPDPLGLTGTYALHGAVAISVLTDEKYFGGHLDILRQIHAALPHMPLLRKDFIFDPYQVYESRATGASAILLIAASLKPHLLAELHALALSLNVTPLVEVHDQRELEAALGLPGLKLMGVNNRNLHTFRVDLQTCLDLRPRVPPEVCFVAESGIHGPEDVRKLAKAGVNAALIGEALVTAADPGAKIQELFGVTMPISEDT